MRVLLVAYLGFHYFAPLGSQRAFYFTRRHLPCDDYYGSPWIIVASGADQQVLDEARFAVTGGCAQGDTGPSRHRTWMVLRRCLVIPLFVLGFHGDDGRVSFSLGHTMFYLGEDFYLTVSANSGEVLKCGRRYL